MFSTKYRIQNMVIFISKNEGCHVDPGARFSRQGKKIKDARYMFHKYYTLMELDIFWLIRPSSSVFIYSSGLPNKTKYI
jgi:hypothetical protein